MIDFAERQEKFLTSMLEDQKRWQEGLLNNMQEEQRKREIAVKKSNRRNRIFDLILIVIAIALPVLLAPVSGMKESVLGKLFSTTQPAPHRESIEMEKPPCT